MTWNPIDYDNITVSRIKFDDIWTPGKQLFVYFFFEIRVLKKNGFKKTHFFTMPPIRVAGINGTRQVDLK